MPLSIVPRHPLKSLRTWEVLFLFLLKQNPGIFDKRSIDDVSGWLMNF